VACWREDDEEKAARTPNAASSNRANSHDSNHEVLSVSTDVPADAVGDSSGVQ
jgi:hypothetical protein